MLLLFCLPRWSQLSILFPYTTLFRSERTIEPWEEVGMPALQLVMHGGEADDLAHPALTRWIQTVEPDLLGRQGEPRSVGMELELQVGHRAAHPVFERLPRVPDVVDHRAVPFLRDRPAEQRPQQPVECAILLHREALHRDAVDHGEADAAAQCVIHGGHDRCAGGQGELRRREEQERERIPAKLAERRSEERRVGKEGRARWWQWQVEER